MRVFGYELTIRKAAPPVRSVVDNRGGWFPLVREPFTGAWQRNIEWSTDSVLAHHAVYACITLIAGDIGKLRIKLVERRNGIWSETEIPRYNRLLRRPNHFQNHVQFKEWWATSKLLRGNTYVLLQRDRDGEVEAMYLLDPQRVQPLVAEDGRVFYQLQGDNLSGIAEAVTVPASEIIHDRINCLFHPLVGVSPIFACGVSATLGLNIEKNAAHFFENGSNPSGILTAPGIIQKETADRLADEWSKNYSGPNSGRVAVVGNGLKFEPLRMSAVDAQMIEHLKMTAEIAASVFHVPGFKIGVGAPPTHNNGELLNAAYYSDCLQSHIEQMEACLDDGLGLMRAGTLGVELDLDALLRMDQATLYKTLGEGVKAGLLAPNEGRRKLDLAPQQGGDTPYLQQQNYSLAALDRRDRDAIEKDMDVQAEALNGAQITALQGLVAAAAAGEIPTETAQAAIAAAFPLLTPAQVEAIMSPLHDTDTDPDPEPPAPPPDDDEDDVMALAFASEADDLSSWWQELRAA